MISTQVLEQALPGPSARELDPSDGELENITSLVVRNKFQAAAEAAERLWQEGIYDARVLGAYLFGVFNERGINSLSLVFECLRRILGNSFEQLSPVERRSHHLDVATRWLFVQLVRVIKFHEQVRDDTWKAWQEPELGATFERAYGECGQLLKLLDERLPNSRARSPLTQLLLLLEGLAKPSQKSVGWTLDPMKEKQERMERQLRLQEEREQQASSESSSGSRSGESSSEESSDASSAGDSGASSGSSPSGESSDSGESGTSGPSGASASEASMASSASPSASDSSQSGRSPASSSSADESAEKKEEAADSKAEKKESAESRESPPASAHALSARSDAGDEAGRKAGGDSRLSMLPLPEGRVEDTLALPISPALRLLLRKLEVAGLLLGHRRYAAAAVVVRDVRRALSSFDPRLYLPALLSAYFAALSQHAGKLAPFMKEPDGDDFAATAARELFELDIDAFLRDSLGGKEP